MCTAVAVADLTVTVTNMSIYMISYTVTLRHAIVTDVGQKEETNRSK